MKMTWQVAAACAIAAPMLCGAPAGAEGPVPLIPRDVLFGNPERANPQISPDGSKISFVAAVDGVLNVWVGPAGDISEAKPVTKDTYRGIRQYFWTYTSEDILYIQDKNGDENWHVYSVDLTTNEIKDLTPIDGIAAQFQGVSPRHPAEILLGINDRNAQLHDVYRVNIETGERTMVQQNDGYAGFLSDLDYNIRIATRMTPDGGMEYLRRSESGDFEPFETIPMEDMLTTSPIGFDASGNLLYSIDSRGRNTAGLFVQDMTTGKKTLLAENARADAGDFIVHPTTRAVQAVAFEYDRVQWTVLDPSIAKDVEYLKTVTDGDFNVINQTLDNNIWMVAYVLDAGPVRYYLYDRQAGKAEYLFSNRPALEKLPLARMHPRIIPSRDGKNLVSYLSLPVWADSDGDGVPAEPVPMVLLVHGGPWGRDSWGYNGYHQWLANRGYAVLSVNFRGSTGFGKDFINAANREWAGKMHDDLIDAVNWAVEKKIASKDKIAIMGGSYGGYATLVGLTFTPDVFACGVDIVGPSNIVTLLNTIPPYWQPLMEMFTSRVGDHRTEEGRKFLESRSPLTFVDRISKPLLIGQGANDPRVKQSESDQIVKAMQAKNIPVTYVLFPDEGHGFARPENSMAFNAVTEAFLAEHLGGEYEPIGDDFSGSTIEVPTGAEQVPGLETAIKSSAK